MSFNLCGTILPHPRNRQSALSSDIIQPRMLWLVDVLSWLAGNAMLLNIWNDVSALLPKIEAHTNS